MPWKKVIPTKIHRLFYPQVSVVITAEFDGRVGGMPAIWHTPLSFKPPLVGVAIAPEHRTYRMIVGAKSFGVNWLDFSYARQVGELGDESVKDYVNKLSAKGFTTVKGGDLEVPLIAEACGVLECRFSDTYRTGTHEFVVGQVVAARANASFIDYWDLARYSPLLYAGTEKRNGQSWIFKSLRNKTTTVPLQSPSAARKANV